MPIDRPHRIVAAAAAAALAAALLSGCAYYNTLYNARKLYREADKAAVAGGSEREQREKYKQVVEKCAKVIADYPKSRWIDDAVFLMGMALLKQGDDEKGIRTLRELRENFPRSEYAPEALYRLSAALEESGEHVQALAGVDTFLAEYPRHELRYRVLFLAGDAKRAMEDPEGAIAFYGRVADEASDRAIVDEARVRSAELFFERGDYAKAAANYERVLRKGMPADLRRKVSLALGQCYARTGRCGEARRLFDDLLDVTTAAQEAAPVLLGSAEGWVCSDSLARALAVYGEVVTKYPKSLYSAEAYFRMGEIREERLDSLRAAQESFGRVSGEYANSPFAAEALERSASIKRLLELRAVSAAGETADQAAEKRFLAAEIQLTKLGDVASALAGYRAVIDSFTAAPAAPRATYAAAWIHRYRLDRPDSAAALYRALVERYPRSPQARGALLELGTLVSDSLRARLRTYVDSALADTAAANAERRAREAAEAAAKRAAGAAAAPPDSTIQLPPGSRPAAPGDTTAAHPRRPAQRDTLAAPQRPAAPPPDATRPAPPDTSRGRTGGTP